MTTMTEAGAPSQTGAEAQIDIVRAEIVRNALRSAAQEMNETLVRSAYNPLIFDVKDFGVGVMGANGDLWADAPGLPVFTGVLPASVRSGLDKYGPDGFRDGDILVANSPYMNGTHISDTAVYMPVFYDGKLVAFAGSMAHWADIGGMSPGGWTVNSTEIYQEGVRFTHQRLYVGGEPNRDVLDLIEANVRVSRIVMGDVHAQIATCKTGADRIIALCDRYGAEVVTELMGYVLAQTEKSLRREIAALPDGTYKASARLDFSGVDRDEVPLIALTTTIAGDRIIVSMEGTSGMSSGPVNCGAEATSASIAETLKGVLDPLGPANQAHLTIADIVWPEEPTMLNPIEPAPCDSYGYAMSVIIEILQLSLADIAPDRVRAGSYQMAASYIMSTRAGSANAYVLAEPVQGGHGAFPGKDGANMMFTGDGDASNTPIEVLEMRYPVFCEQFSLNEESAGAGQFRGGMGVRRDLRVLQEHSMIKTAFESTIDPISKGAQGGEAGDTTYVELRYPGLPAERQDERLSDSPVPVGFVLATRTGGGGGFGHPATRDPARVAIDVRDDYVTQEQARDIYRVHLIPGELPGTWIVDEEQTSILRELQKQD